MSRPAKLNETAAVRRDLRSSETLCAQVRLLYDGAHVSSSATIIAASFLAYLEWNTLARPLVVGWWLYLVLVSASRSILAANYRRASQGCAESGSWNARFAVGSSLAGVGWGAAGYVLYQKVYLPQHLFIIFVLGGMMLGAASLLAARREAFLSFMIPIGLGPTVALLLEGGEQQMVMGLLSATFSVATILTTARIHRSIASALALQFENRDLLEDLKAANSRTEALNQALERRVLERTAELNESTEKLRAEIAQREQMEEELLRARKLESLGVLAGGIAHDFNNFLTVVQGNIEIAGARLADPDHPAQEALAQAAATCRRAALLSSQLLTFAKGGAPVRRVVWVAKLVNDAVRLARAGAPAAITVTLPQDLYSARVDPGQIGQVLHNILLNARQAMPQGGIIDVNAENVPPENPAAEPRIRISVRDYGCGIPAGVLPRIFDPYFTTKPEGSGLGLATAYSIVAKHGGRIDVESEEGSGAVFTIDLPATTEVPEPEAPPPAAPIETGRERILVMDDEQALRRLIGNVLSELGYQAQTARDGAEAIALFEAARAGGKPFDAVLLDLTVSGGMGGQEAAVKLREIDPACKLIVSSGYSQATIMSEFGRYGFDAVLPKPWTMADVSRVLRRVLA